MPHQGKNFKSVVSKDKITLVPMLDIEKQSKGNVKSSTQLQKHVREWVTLCQGYYGRKPIIYSSVGFYIRYLKGKFDDCLFWAGDVDASKAYLNMVDWSIWQYEIGPVKGALGMLIKVL